LTIKYNFSRINFNDFQGPDINRNNFKDVKEKIKGMGDKIEHGIDDIKGVMEEKKENK